MASSNVASGGNVSTALRIRSRWLGSATVALYAELLRAPTRTEADA